MATAKAIATETTAGKARQTSETYKYLWRSYGWKWWVRQAGNETEDGQTVNCNYCLQPSFKYNCNKERKGNRMQITRRGCDCDRKQVQSPHILVQDAWDLRNRIEYMEEDVYFQWGDGFINSDSKLYTKRIFISLVYTIFE